MIRFAFRRLCVALMVVTFLAGLPMQGSVMASQMSLTASGELSMPDGCTACGDDPAMNMTCPVVFCFGLSAVFNVTTEVSPLPLDQTWFGRQDTDIGLTLGPDPHPPRTPIEA